MAKPAIRLSEGAQWVVNRMPNSLYPQFQRDMEEAIEAVMHQYGYTSGIAMAFRDQSPATVERD